ncbi:MAG TPA: hypothetical protein VGI80_02885, partial [Pyrinomonadaceae bacterium]
SRCKLPRVSRQIATAFRPWYGSQKQKQVVSTPFSLQPQRTLNRPTDPIHPSGHAVNGVAICPSSEAAYRRSKIGDRKI